MPPWTFLLPRDKRACQDFTGCGRCGVLDGRRRRRQFRMTASGLHRPSPVGVNLGPLPCTTLEAQCAVSTLGEGIQASCIVVDELLGIGEHLREFISKGRGLEFLHPRRRVSKSAHSSLPSRHRNFNEASPTSPRDGDTHLGHQKFHFHDFVNQHIAPN